MKLMVSVILCIITHPLLAQLTAADTIPNRAKLFSPEITKDGVYLTVHQRATFADCEMGWRKYLERNLDANTPVDHGAPEGKYTVVYEFIVETDGRLTNITPLSKNGYGTEQEVLELLQKSPAWTPAKVHGKNVRSLMKQPVTFIVSSENSELPAMFRPFPADTTAGFWGGPEALKHFIESRLNYMVPFDNKAPLGKYETIVEFTIESDGTLTNFKKISNHGYGMEDEVIRMLQCGPTWFAARARGKRIKSTHRQSVFFIVDAMPGDKAF